MLAALPCVCYRTLLIGIRCCYLTHFGRRGERDTVSLPPGMLRMDRTNRWLVTFGYAVGLAFFLVSEIIRMLRFVCAYAIPSLTIPHNAFRPLDPTS